MRTDTLQIVTVVSGEWSMVDCGRSTMEAQLTIQFSMSREGAVVYTNSHLPFIRGEDRGFLVGFTDSSFRTICITSGNVLSRISRVGISGEGEEVYEKLVCILVYRTIRTIRLPFRRIVFQKSKIAKK